MTPEQRSHIDNGIWLCASCSILIDRDEKRFTAKALQRIKREHEISRQIGNAGSGREGDIIAIGPDIIAVGRVEFSGPAGMRVRLFHFVEGSARDLLSLTQDFDKHLPEKRYVLMNELGSGGLLEHAPNVDRAGRDFVVQFQLRPNTPRRDATAQIVSTCSRTGRWLTGMDAYIQNFERLLGWARGTRFNSIKDGSDLSDLYWRYHGSPWFERLAMMEIIRHSSIPIIFKGGVGPATPFICVNRVNRVDVPTFELEGRKLRIGVDLQIEGLGPWSGELSVFISTPEELMAYRADAQARHETIQKIEAEYGKTR